MWPSIRPNINAVEVIDELLEMEQDEPYMQNEMIIIFISIRAVTEEIDILSHALSVANIFQHDDAILHDRVIRLMPDFRGEVS